MVGAWILSKQDFHFELIGAVVAWFSTRLGFVVTSPLCFLYAGRRGRAVFEFITAVSL